MLFNSVSFAFFFPIVFIVYWSMPYRFRWMILLISSYYFYMSWNLKYVLLIFGTTVVSYISGRLLENGKSKRLILAGASAVCLGVLFLFKYFNFAIESFCSVLRFVKIDLAPVTFKLLLPVGISFYTFQTLSYVIDVYRGKVKAEHHFGYYATFISFFPQLVAGPIERTNNLLPQIRKTPVFSYSKSVDGMKRIAWGYFKKIVVADTLAIYVDMVYGSLSKYTGFSLVLAVFFFTIQIYCDFSGYSDIAIGTAGLLGIDLMQNFDCPYFSTSIKEFWKKWHISLSTWFRDYVYIPLGGNRCSAMRQKMNLLITFLVSGLWHGANWTYVLWGGVHGVAQIIEDIFSAPIANLKKRKAGVLVSWLTVFIFCNITWIFFRAASVQDAFYVLTHWWEGLLLPFTYILEGVRAVRIDTKTGLKIALILGMLIAGDGGFVKGKWGKIFNNFPLQIKWILYMAYVWAVWFLIPASSGGEFIYFQF